MSSDVNENRRYEPSLLLSVINYSSSRWQRIHTKTARINSTPTYACIHRMRLARCIYASSCIDVRDGGVMRRNFDRSWHEQSVSQLANQPTSQSVSSQSVSQSVSQSISQSISQSVTQLVSQSVSHSVTQSNSQLISK